MRGKLSKNSMTTPKKQWNYSHETSVVILLILMIVVGVIYNIIEKKSPPDFSLCPLCNESVIYYQNEGVKLPDETITF